MSAANDLKLMGSAERACNRCGIVKPLSGYYKDRQSFRTICISCARAAEERRYAANPHRAKAATAAWMKANPERVKTYMAAWYRANRDLHNVHQEIRRARKMGSGGKLSPGIAKKLYALQRGLCACCGKPLGKDYHKDHIMPLALGGRNEDSNIQLLRATCNLQKKAAHPVDFMQKRGFLL